MFGFCKARRLNRIIDNEPEVAERHAAGLDRRLKGAMQELSDTGRQALNDALALQAEQSRADRDRLELALAASGVIGVWDGDLVERKVYGDAHFARIYRIDAAAAAAGQPLRHYFQFMHPEDRPRVEAAMERMLAGADEFAEEHRIIRPDGTVLWVLARGRLIRDAAGRPVRFPGISMDITDRKLAETRQAFLVTLQDQLRDLGDTEAILQAAAAALGAFLGAQRIGFGQVQPDGETVLVKCGYTAEGVPPVTGLFPLSAFGAGNTAQARAGRTLVSEDVQAERGAGEVWDNIGTRAHVSVPLIRGGQYRGSLYVTFFTPRRWAAADVTLIEEVAARIWDAAERGRVESELRDSEERARLALESGGLGSWVYDVAADRTIRSPRHAQIFGHETPLDAWSFATFMGHVVPEDREAVEASFHATLATGADWQAVCRIRTAAGVERWIEARAKAHLDAGGAVTRLVGITADITDRKRAEAALVASETLFRSFAQAMPNQVWTAPPDGLLDWFNDRVLAYAGLEAAALMGTGWTAMVHPDDVAGAAARWAAALASGDPYECEFRLRRHDGAYRWYIARAVPIRDGAGRITRWIGTNTDIEDQKTTAQALADLNATLEAQVAERTAELMAAEDSLRQSQKMEAVGQLTGGIAHDFNNMLQGIAGAVELMERRIAQGRPEEAARYVASARQSIARAATLTHQLLAFSRRQALAPKRVDLNELVNGIAGLIQQTVGPAIAFSLRLKEAGWPVRCDPNQMENALLNLAINARDAMLPAGGALTLETAHVALTETDVTGWDGAAAGPHVRITVTDTGSGMTPEVMQHAFEPFFTTKPVGQGTGLGLSQVYGFVRQSNGMMRLESAPGLGTSVHLYLPLHAELEEGAAAAGDEVRPSSGKGATVLLVEDEPQIREFAAEALRDLGYTVWDAKDALTGLTALRAARKAGKVDLLLADIGLPGGMNGRQLGMAARELIPDLPVLLITGYAGDALGPDAALGPDFFLLGKPFTLQALAARVETILLDRKPGGKPRLESAVMPPA
jgi:PAS domain S-box-containing protein